MAGNLEMQVSRIHKWLLNIYYPVYGLPESQALDAAIYADLLLGTAEVDSAKVFISRKCHLFLCICRRLRQFVRIFKK